MRYYRIQAVVCTAAVSEGWTLGIFRREWPDIGYQDYRAFQPPRVEKRVYATRLKFMENRIISITKRWECV